MVNNGNETVFLKTFQSPKRLMRSFISPFFWIYVNESLLKYFGWNIANNLQPIGFGLKTKLIFSNLII